MLAIQLVKKYNFLAWCMSEVCVSMFSSVFSDATNSSMGCGTFEQLEYWPNNFDDFAVSCPTLLNRCCLFVLFFSLIKKNLLVFVLFHI